MKFRETPTYLVVELGPNLDALRKASVDKPNPEEYVTGEIADLVRDLTIMGDATGNLIDKVWELQQSDKTELGPARSEAIHECGFELLDVYEKNEIYYDGQARYQFDRWIDRNSFALKRVREPIVVDKTPVIPPWE